MNLYNGNEDEKKDAAPMLGRASSPFKRNSTFGRTPMLSRAAGGILERLKNLSRKDMAFVGVGLSVLVMAPVAEYMMSKPSTDNMLASGFGSRNGSAAGGGLYEPGINALSQGSADGNGEVITPLSSRDPASLILGAQAAQPMVASAPPPDTSMRDAVRDSGRAAFSEAVKSAGAPTPIPRMSAAMRSSMFGSSGETRTAGSLSGKAIIDDAKSASSKAAKRSMVGPVAPAGYKGVSNNTPNSASKSALDKLRAQGDKAASNFSDASASRGLDNAAAQAINADANGGSGAGSSGVGSKNPSNSTNKNSHSNQGECKTLACEAEKKRQEKALEWEFFKKYEIPKQIINAVVSGFTSSLTKFVTGITDKLTGQGGGGAATYVCLGKLVETTPCFPPKPAGGGAAPVNVTELDRSSDEKEVGAWTVGDGKICPCGKKNADAYDALGKAADGKDNTVKPSVEPGLTPEAAAALVTAKFADYDNELKLMLLTAKEGAETDNPGQLIKDTKAIADSFPRLRANELAAAIKAKAIAEKTGSGSIAAYAANINSAQMELNTIRSEYEIFKRKLDNVAKAAEDGKLKVGISGTGGITYSVASSEFLPYIRTAKTSMEKDQSPYSMIEEVNAKLAVNDSKKEAYIAHIGFASDGTDQVTEEYTAALAEAQRVSKDMSTTPLTIDIVRADFEKLTGFKPAVPGSGASAKLSPDALAFNTSGITDFRDQAASPSVPLLNSAKMWRGLNIEKPFGKDKANDTEAIAAEIKSWKAVTPRDKTADITSDNNLAKKNLLAEYLRGLGEVPADAKYNKLDPSAEVTTLADVRTQIEKIRKQLVDTWKINMDNPTGEKVTGDDTPPDSHTGSNEVTAEQLNAVYNGYDTKVANVNKGYTDLPARSRNPNNQAAYKELKGTAYEKNEAVKAAAKKFQDLKAGIAAADTPAKRAALLVEINKAKANLDKALDEAGKANASALEMANRPVLAPTQASLNSIKKSGETLYGKIVSAKTSGDSLIGQFPKGAYVKAELEKAVAEQKSLVQYLKTANGNIGTIRNATEATKDKAGSALASLRQDASSAALALKHIQSALAKAKATPVPLSANCWERSEGCATLSGFYLSQVWSPISAEKFLFLYSGSGVIGRAQDRIAHKHAGKWYTTAQRDNICEKEIGGFLEGALSLLNFHTLSTAKSECKKRFFAASYLLGYHVNGDVSSGGDYVRMVASRISNGEIKTYEGSAQSAYNIAFQLLCAKNNAGVWKVTATSLRIDQPKVYTESQSFSVGVTQSGVSAGVSVSQSIGKSIPYGAWQQSAYHGGFCGSRADSSVK